MAEIIRETIRTLHKSGKIGRAKNSSRTHPLLSTRLEIYRVIEQELIKAGYHPWSRVAMTRKETPHATQELADKAKDTYWQECCMDCQQFHWHGNRYVGDQRSDIQSNLYRPVLLYSPWSRAWNSSPRNLVPWGPSVEFSHNHLRHGDIVNGNGEGIVLSDNDGLFVVWNDGLTIGEIDEVTSVTRGELTVDIGSKPREKCPPTEFYFVNPYNVQSEARFMENGRIPQKVVNNAIVWHSAPVSGHQMRHRME